MSAPRKCAGFTHWGGCMTDKINLTQLMERAWADDGLRQDFATHLKAVYAREIGEVIPDFIDIKLLQENPKLVWLVMPPKPPNISSNSSGDTVR